MYVCMYVCTCSVRVQWLGNHSTHPWITLWYSISTYVCIMCAHMVPSAVSVCRSLAVLWLVH